MITRLRYPKGYQFLDSNGAPLALGSLSYFAAGTTTPQDTYSDSAGAVPNTNPVILDGAGRLGVDVYLGPAADYKEVLTAGGAAMPPWPGDNIPRAALPDWSASSGPSQILNKPEFAAVAFSGSYRELSDVPATLFPFTGDSGSGGSAGLVPAPAAGNALANMFLSASGNWATPPGAAVSINLIASAATGSGSTLTFATVPASITAGMLVTDTTNSSAIPGGTVVVSTTSASVTLSAPVAGSGVAAGNIINFSGSQSAVTNLSVFESPNSVSIGSSSGSGISIPAATHSAAGALDAARAVKIDNLATVAASGSYADLSNKPANMAGATPGAAGQAGFVPPPPAGQQLSFLRGDGSWAIPMPGPNLDNIGRLGINTTDAGNKLSVNGPAALFSNSGDVRISMSKGAASNIAAFNFQNSFSTRAQFGLLGNDNFSISVSPDGSAFHNALIISPSGTLSLGFDGGSNPLLSADSASVRPQKPLKLPAFTIAGLPSAASVGAGTEAWVTDSAAAFTAVNFGTIAAGGGSNGARVISNGTTWIIA
jgi:hypothetical protein